MNIVKKTTEAAIRNYENYLESKAASDFEKKRILREQSAIHEEVITNKLDGIAKQKAFSEFATTVKESLMADYINYIYEGCFNKIYSEDSNYENIKGNLVMGFIKSEGVNKLLNRFKYQSEMLAEAALLIEESTKTILEKCADSKCSFSLDTCDRDNFYDKMMNASPEAVTNRIRARVGDAFEDFITKNAENRMEIKSILQQTQEKIDSTKNDAVKESYSAIAKRKISNINNKPKSVFEAVVYKLSKAAMTKPELKEAYLDSDGHLKMDAIVESSKVIYTFLEMLNTTKMVDMNESTVKDVLQNMFK